MRSVRCASENRATREDHQRRLLLSFHISDRVVYCIRRTALQSRLDGSGDPSYVPQPRRDDSLSTGQTIGVVAEVVRLRTEAARTEVSRLRLHSNATVIHWPVLTIDPERRRQCPLEFLDAVVRYQRPGDVERPKVRQPGKVLQPSIGDLRVGQVKQCETVKPL